MNRSRLPASPYQLLPEEGSASARSPNPMVTTANAPTASLQLPRQLWNLRSSHVVFARRAEHLRQDNVQLLQIGDIQQEEVVGPSAGD